MIRSSRARGLLCLLAIGLARIVAGAPAPRDLALADFQRPPAEVRTRVFWRVFGPSWTRPEIDFQLQLLKDAGVGGVTAFFMYPVAVNDEERGVRNMPFLAPAFLDTLTYASRRARELGLHFGVAGGTGWPFGGPTVTSPDSARQLRLVTPARTAGADQAWPLPALKKDERRVAVFLRSRDVTSFLRGDVLTVPGDDGSAIPQVFIDAPTGMQVKRSALGAEGLVLDHLNRAAVQRYLAQVVTPLTGAGPADSVFCDSLEVYGANWTRRYPDAFASRRGYDLKAFLPQLFDRASAAGADLRFDFWRTHAELVEDQFIRTVHDWAQRHRVRFEMEAYGTPPCPLTSARFIVEPVGEQYEWKGFSLSRLAASGAHLAGRRIIGAEAWTWLGIPNRLADSLSDLKLASDLHFLAGVNDLIGVDFAYSPRSAGAPGWMPYYGPVLNQNNPQWPWFRHLVDYTSRCQWLLRRGRPVADVALYLPVEDTFADGPVDQMVLGLRLRDRLAPGAKKGEFGLEAALQHHSNVIHGLISHGFDYDGIDFFAMNQLARVRAGRLEAGDGAYRIAVLPNLEAIDLEALKKVAAFCRAGGTVIATRRLPITTRGVGKDAQRAKVKTLVAELFGPVSGQPTQHAYGRGRACFVPDDTTSLGQLLDTLEPDVMFEPRQAEVGFVHRHEDSRDIYFLANVGETSRAFSARFAHAAGRVSLWDPLTARVVTPISIRGISRPETIPIQLSARGSMFVVFDRAATPNPAPASLPPPVAGAMEAAGTMMDLDIVWTLSFPGSNGPTRRELRELVSWTSWPETQFYSGSAEYLGQFVWDKRLPGQASLVFSGVREVASIQINGREAGALLTPPWEIDLTGLLRPGTNTLLVTVANLPLNRFLGTPDEDLKPLRAAYGTRFPDPSEKQVAREPAASGLIGPVRLRFIP